MGTDIYPILTVRQLENREKEPENVKDIIDAIETEFGKRFEENGDAYESMRWAGMVEDMTEFSKKHPGVLFGIRYEWPEDGSEYMEWFENGRYYCDARPEWEPIFQEAKFLKGGNAPEPVAAEPAIESAMHPQRKMNRMIADLQSEGALPNPHHTGAKAEPTTGDPYTGNVYSILITYPDQGSWFGEGRGDTVEEAIADARRQINEENGAGGEPAGWDDDELEVLLVIAGEHQDLKP